jgi:hypothetical protein
VIYSVFDVSLCLGEQVIHIDYIGRKTLVLYHPYFFLDFSFSVAY